MGKIILGNTIYTFEAIKNGNWFENDPYLHEALVFCQQWLSGKENFAMQTSGSTGIPKTVKVRRDQMVISAAATKEFFNIPITPLLLCCLNTTLIAGKMMLVRAMEWDAIVILVNPQLNPLELVDTEVDFDFVAMVPLQVAAAMANDVTLSKLKKVKQLIIGGAPSHPSLIAKIIANKIPAYQTYGMTETVSHIALAKIDHVDLVYHALPTVKLGTDDSGRLFIEAPMAIAEKIQTNDVVELLSPTAFKWMGRADFTINSGGIKIQPEQVEALLAPFLEPYYQNASYFVFGKADEILGQKMVLAIEEKEKNPAREAKVLASIKNNLQKYHVPKEIVAVPVFVKTVSGKINRLETIKSIL